MMLLICAVICAVLGAHVACADDGVTRPHDCCRDDFQFLNNHGSVVDENGSCDCPCDWSSANQPAPRYDFQAEALILHRSATGSNSSNQPLIINTITDATLLSTSD